MLCKYRDVFGKVGEGAHSYRIFNIAIVDLGLTLAVGLLIGYFYKFNIWQTIILCLILLLIGILFHRLFCVNTTINKLIFGKV